MTSSSPDEYRHRTTDLWEASALWALGFTASHTEVQQDDDHLVFVWPDMGDALLEAVKSYRSGDAKVNPLSIQQGYYQMRNLMREPVRHASAAS